MAVDSDLRRVVNCVVLLLDEMSDKQSSPRIVGILHDLLISVQRTDHTDIVSLIAYLNQLNTQGDGSGGSSGGSGGSVGGSYS